MVMSKTKRIVVCLVLFLLLAGVVLYRMHAERMRKFAAAETCGQYREVASLLGEPIAIYHLDDETELGDINHKARAESVGENRYGRGVVFRFRYGPQCGDLAQAQDRFRSFLGRIQPDNGRGLPHGGNLPVRGVCAPPRRHCGDGPARRQRRRA